MVWRITLKARWLVPVLVLLLCSVLAARGSEAPQAAPAAPVTLPTPVGEDVPVAVPPPSEKALRHYRTGNVWWCVRTLWEMALPAAVLFTGFSARLRDLAMRWGRKWYFALGLYFAVLMLLNYAVSWPLDYWQEFVRPHAYGLSNQTFGKWFGDSLKELTVTVVLGVVFLWVPYLLLRKSPRRWWLYAALGMVPVYFFLQFLRPIAFDPLFNLFTPLQDQTLKAQILTLADRAGIHGSRVYQVDKSTDTPMVNAYVTGFMGTKRIVLWDTALHKLDDRELLFVMGHEMGHYVLGHVTKGILVLSALTLVAFYLVHRTAAALIGRWRTRFGFDCLSDFGSLPLIVLLLNVFALVLTPIGFAYSRHIEHEADRFGLEITRYNHSAATGFTRLQEEELGVPRHGLLYTIMRATHPSIGDRIDFFNSYKPWARGEPLKYESYFEPEPKTPRPP
jgi:STE24 endopeptidase